MSLPYSTDTIGDDHNRPTLSALVVTVTVVTGIGVGVFIVFTVMFVASADILHFHRCTKARPLVVLSTLLSNVHLHACMYGCILLSCMRPNAGTRPTHSPAEKDCSLTVNPAYQNHTLAGRPHLSPSADTQEPDLNMEDNPSLYVLRITCKAPEDADTAHEYETVVNC